MTPWVGRLMAANAVVFFLTLANTDLANLLAFRPLAVFYRPWTVITYMFVHANFMHIFFNMLMLFFFGPRVELQLGSVRFLRLYLYSGLGGALLSFVFSPLFPIVGASGAVYGVMLAFTMYWPREPIYIWGVFPVEARWLMAFMIIVSVMSGFGGSADGVAHFAHLGGLAGAFVYVKLVQRSHPQMRAVRERQRELRVHEARADQDIGRWSAIDVQSLHEVNRDEVQRLLDKVRNAGVTSLSREERAFLDNFARPA